MDSYPGFEDYQRHTYAPATNSKHGLWMGTHPDARGFDTRCANCGLWLGVVIVADAGSLDRAKRRSDSHRCDAPPDGWYREQVARLAAEGIRVKTDAVVPD